MENSSNKKESKKITAKGLIEKGKKQGTLTLAEIMEAIMPDAPPPIIITS